MYVFSVTLPALWLMIVLSTATSEPAPYATPIEMHTLDDIPPPMTQGPQWAYSSGAARAGASAWATSLTMAVLVGVLGVLYH